MALQTYAIIMRDFGIDKGFVKQMDTSDRSKRGWVKGVFGFRKMFWDYLKKLHVPFFDECCPTAAEDENMFPVRYNGVLLRLEYFNGSDWVDIPNITETTTTTTTSTTTTTTAP